MYWRSEKSRFLISRITPIDIAIGHFIDVQAQRGGIIILNTGFLKNGLISGVNDALLIGNRVFSHVVPHRSKRATTSPHVQEVRGAGERPIPLMLDWMRLRAGERVLELGAGSGQFTIQAARRIGNRGRLYAFDIQPEMIAQIQQKIEAARLTNIHAQITAPCELPLTDGGIDKAMLINVLPQIPYHRDVLYEVARVLQPHGTLYIGGEFAEPDYWFINETVRNVERTGLFVLSTQRGNWWRYMVGFRKRGSHGSASMGSRGSA
jgi:SAM-dependent methyltransferase